MTKNTNMAKYNKRDDESQKKDQMKNEQKEKKEKWTIKNSNDEKGLELNLGNREGHHDHMEGQKLNLGVGQGHHGSVEGQELILGIRQGLQKHMKDQDSTWALTI